MNRPPCSTPCAASSRNGDCPCCRAYSRGALLYPVRVIAGWLRRHSIELEVAGWMAVLVLLGCAWRFL